MYGYFICNVQSKVIRKKCYIHKKKKQKNVIDRKEKKRKTHLSIVGLS